MLLLLGSLAIAALYVPSGFGKLTGQCSFERDLSARGSAISIGGGRPMGG